MDKTNDTETKNVVDITPITLVSSQSDISQLNGFESEETEPIDDEPDYLETTDSNSLDDVIVKALEKVKSYFLCNDIEEQKLAEFIFKILTLNNEDMDLNCIKSDSEILNKLVDEVTESNTKIDSDSFRNLLESLFGPNTIKMINEKVCTEKIDEIVEGLLGKDTTKMICDRLECHNLDELLNNLIDEKLNDDPQAKHPNFDGFIDKVLGIETKDFIKRKLQAFLDGNENNGKILEVKDI